MHFLPGRTLGPQRESRQRTVCLKTRGRSILTPIPRPCSAAEGVEAVLVEAAGVGADDGAVVHVLLVGWKGGGFSLIIIVVFGSIRFFFICSII